MILLRRDTSPDPGAPDPVTPAPVTPVRRRPALLLAGTASVGAALGQYGASGWGWGYLLATAAGVALVVLSAPRLLPSGTWRAARGLAATVLAAGLGSGVYFTIEAYVPLLLTTYRHVPSTLTGLAFTLAALTWSATSWAQGHPLRDVPRHRLAVAGALLLAVAAVIAGAGAYHGLPAITSGLALAVAAAGMGLFAPAVTLLVFQHAPPGEQGYASSAFQMAQSLGQMIVIAAAAAPYNLVLHARLPHQVSYLAAFCTVLPLCALAGLAAARARGTS